MMEAQKLLQSSLEDLKRITKSDFGLFDAKGESLASTFEAPAVKAEELERFLKSEADSQNLRGYLFIRLTQGEEYVLLVQSRDHDGYMLGQIAGSEILHLLRAFQEEPDERHFYQDLFEERMSQQEILDKATALAIPETAHRVVYLVEMDQNFLESGKELLRNLFDENEIAFIDSLEQKHIVLIKYLKNKKDENKRNAYACQMESMLNTEIMAPARIAYSNAAHSLGELSKSYREAKVALEVAQIFYDGRTIADYSSLGIGRLIHELPLPLCEMFLDEVFGGRKLNLTEEELTTIDKFFSNNLNISETARDLFIHRNTLVYHLEKLQKTTGLDIRRFDDALTFKIAAMVARYLKYLRQ